MMKMPESLPRMSLLAGLAGVAAMLGYVTLFWDNTQPAALLRGADAVAIDFRALEPRGVTYGEDGFPRRSFSAAELVHYRLGDYSEFSSPVFEIVASDNTVWHSNSLRGSLDRDDVLELSGNVLVADAGRTTQLQTEALRWDERNQQASSDLPVLLIHQTHTIRAVGMRADLASDRVELLNQVEGLHVIP